MTASGHAVRRPVHLSCAGARHAALRRASPVNVGYRQRVSGCRRVTSGIGCLAQARSPSSMRSKPDTARQHATSAPSGVQRLGRSSSSGQACGSTPARRARSIGSAVSGNSTRSSASRNFRKTAEMTIEKMPPPMSVMRPEGRERRRGRWRRRTGTRRTTRRRRPGRPDGQRLAGRTIVLTM